MNGKGFNSRKSIVDEKAHKNEVIHELTQDLGHLYEKICRGQATKEEEKRWLAISGKDAACTVAEKQDFKNERRKLYNRLRGKMGRGTASKDEEVQWFKLFGTCTVSKPAGKEREAVAKKVGTGKTRAELAKSKSRPRGPFKMNLNSVRGRIYRGTADEEDKAKYFELTGKDASTVPRETVTQREARLASMKKWWDKQRRGVVKSAKEDTESAGDKASNGKTSKEEPDSSDSESDSDDDEEVEDAEEEEDAEAEILRGADRKIQANKESPGKESNSSDSNNKEEVEEEEKDPEAAIARKRCLWRDGEAGEKKRELERQKKDRDARHHARLSEHQQENADTDTQSSESSDRCNENEDPVKHAERRNRSEGEGEAKSAAAGVLMQNEANLETVEGREDATVAATAATQQQNAELKDGRAIGETQEGRGDSQNGRVLDTSSSTAQEIVDLTLSDDEDDVAVGGGLEGGAAAAATPDTVASQENLASPVSQEFASGPATVPVVAPAATRMTAAAGIVPHPQVPSAAAISATEGTASAVAAMQEFYSSTTQATQPAPFVEPMTPVSADAAVSNSRTFIPAPVATPSGPDNDAQQEYRTLRLFILTERDNRDDVIARNGLVPLGEESDSEIPEIPGADIMGEIQKLKFELEDVKRTNRHLLKRIRSSS